MQFCLARGTWGGWGDRSRYVCTYVCIYFIDTYIDIHMFILVMIFYIYDCLSVYTHAYMYIDIDIDTVVARNVHHGSYQVSLLHHTWLQHA